MSQKLAGSVCVITGASAGIGRACALALANEGAYLVLTARRQHRLDELVETINSTGAQALDKELHPYGIKVGVICPGGVKTEFALGKGRTEESVAQSGMLDPEDVAGVVLLACTQSSHSRIIEIQMRPMVEPLT